MDRKVGQETEYQVGVGSGLIVRHVLVKEHSAQIVTELSVDKFSPRRGGDVVEIG